MGLVVAGMLNKQIASEIGSSEATVKIHRGNVMQKMHAGSLIESVRLADKLNLFFPNSVILTLCYYPAPQVLIDYHLRSRLPGVLR